MSNENIAIENKARLVNSLDWNTLKHLFPKAYCYIEHEIDAEIRRLSTSPYSRRKLCSTQVVQRTKIDLRRCENPTEAFMYATRKGYKKFTVVRCVPELNCA